MPLTVSPSIPTESSTAAPAGGLSTWFKNIGDWIKLLSPAGASQYDTDWVTLTLASGFAAQGSPAPQIRRIGKIVEMRGLVKASTGNIPTTDTLAFTIDPEFRPSAYLTRSAAGQTLAAHHRLVIQSPGTVTIAASTASSWISIGQIWMVD